MRIALMFFCLAAYAGDSTETTIIDLDTARIEATGVQVEVSNEEGIWVIRIAPKPASPEPQRRKP